MLPLHSSWLKAIWRVGVFERLMASAAVLLLVASCAVHRDFLTGFVVHGKVSGTNGGYNVTLIDESMDSKRPPHLRVIASNHFPEAGPFNLSESYFWGTEKTSHLRAAVVRLVISADQCRDEVRRISIESL